MNDLVEKAIEFVDVHFSDQQVAIIKGITGYIEKGKIMTLVGPSGAGKTTIFKLINGLISPTKGDILIEGKKHKGIRTDFVKEKSRPRFATSDDDCGIVFDHLALPKN